MIRALHSFCHFLVFVRFDIVQTPGMVPQELVDVVRVSRVFHLKILHGPEQESDSFMALTNAGYLKHA